MSAQTLAPPVAPQPTPTAAALTATPRASLVHRVSCLAYSGGVYACFLGVFVAMIAFVTGVFLPKTVNSGPAVDLGRAIAINAAFLLLFAVQHTIMARPRFKAWFTRFVPVAIERSTFVLVTCVIVTAMLVFWQPMPEIVWSVASPTLRVAIFSIAALGWCTVLVSTFLIDHFDLFGLRQAWLHFRGRERPGLPFTKRGLYRWIRHPLMTGFLIAFWAAPTMSQGHLLLASLVTAYVLVGIRFEERDLVRALGSAYESYRRETPALIPRMVRRAQ